MILEQVRSATESLHRRVESHLALMDPRLTLNQYVEMLKAMRGIYAPIERAVAHASGAGHLLPFARDREKAWRIDQDLLALNAGMNWHEAAIIPPFENDADALGALYVTEGSTLGGQVIARHVSRVLNLTPARGLSFFHGAGDLTVPRWRECCALLRAQPQSAWPRITAAAVATFASFDRHLASHVTHWRPAGVAI